MLLVLQLPGADAGKPDVKGAAEKAVKKSPLGFMNVGELSFDLPGSGVSKDDLPNNVKPGDAAGLPKGLTAKPPSLPSLPKVLPYMCVIMWVLVTKQMRHVLLSCKRDVLACIRFAPSLFVCTINTPVLVTIGLHHCCHADCGSHLDTLLHRNSCIQFAVHIADMCCCSHKH